MGHKLERKSDSIVYALHRDENNIMGIVDQRKDGGGVYGIWSFHANEKFFML